MRVQNILLLGTLLCSPLLAEAEDQLAKNQNADLRARMEDVKEQSKFRELVDETYDVYEAFVKGPHGQVPSSILKNARCIAILPNALTGAVLVGGTYGSGLASCKDSDEAWSQPAAISLSQGSVGLQAGAKSSDLLLFFQSAKAEEALKRGEFAIGTDLSAVAGNFDTQVDTSDADVVAYTRTSGLFAGASVNGTKIRKDIDNLEAYYGKKVDYVALLEGRAYPDTSKYSKKLTDLFPNY